MHGTPEYDSDGEYYFLNGNNIGNENLVFKDNTDRISEFEYKKYKPVNISENTILITLNGATYGKTSFYRNEKILLGKSAGYITLKNGENKCFVRFYLQSNIARLIMELIIFSFKRIFSQSPLLQYNVLAKEDFAMKEQKRFLELSGFEWRLLIKCLNEARSLFLNDGKPVEDIDELLIKAFKMKYQKARI